VTDYVAVNGYRPGGMWLSTQTMNYMLANSALRTMTGTILGASTLINRGTVDSLLSQFTLPPVLGVYDAQVDVDDVSTRVLPANKIIFVPPAGQELGYTAWGITATALELINSRETDFSFEEAPGIVGVVEKNDAPPYRQYTFVDAVGMPVLTNSKALMVATVA
jgi:hypothetical protein